MEYKGYNVPEDLMYDKNHFWKDVQMVCNIKPKL